MKGFIGIGIFLVVFLVCSRFPQMLAAEPVSTTAVPRSAVVEIVLLKAPGLNVAGSKWEIAYEFRITNETSLWTERAKFNGTSKERVGDLLKQGTVKNPLESQSGQKLHVEIPFTTETLARLRNQPTTRINLTSATTTAKNVKLTQEQELKSQVFLFYSVVSVYDAKLKKTLTIPVSRVWDFEDFPEAKFEIRIEIEGENSYRVNSSLPKNATGRQLEIHQ